MVEFGNAGTILVAREDTYLLCEAARGEACRAIVTHAAPVQEIAFSEDGRILLIAFEDRLLVAGGKSGEALLDTPVRPAPAPDAGPRRPAK